MHREESADDHRHRPIFTAEADQLRGRGARLSSTAPKYQGLQGLIRKYYLRSEDGRRAGGVYLWETRAAAEAVYNGEWKRGASKQPLRLGAEINWFDTPVIVDNRPGGSITKAA